MSFLLILLLSIFRLRTLRCEIPDTPGVLVNSVDDNEQPAELEITSPKPYDKFLPDLISSINIDYTNNALILHFRKAGQFGDEKKKLDKNFMRFGRSDSALMRFGKRQVEFLDADPDYQGRGGDNGARDSRGDNFMRFGRANGDGGNLMRFGRQSPQASDRTDRGSDASMFRFGRGSDNSLMRFGRADHDFMRFGRNNGMMRFGRSDSFMRLGRASVDDKFRQANAIDPYISRYGRNDKNFMRFGKLDQNFMRFGKRSNQADGESAEHKKSISKSEPNYLDNLWKTDEFTTADSKLDNAVQDKLFASQ
ncbi:unnamed protein product [Hermetia illucens]|uniref:Uncharacterized protein n=1 Tax=Hermetia illucens TaxID=343691 RepID=A0A7R8YMD9_HERIL|nr:FMRFamide-related peptides [Hermetia illucens]CAD7077367.1 unnamed protein product [Hermetia illucens]